MGIAIARHTVRTIAVGVVSALLLAVAMAGSALAQSVYPPAADLSVACTPELPSPGDTVTCTISGAPGNTTLEIVVVINPELFDGQVTTDADGEASFSFDVPDDAQAGDTITIVVEGDEIEGSLTAELTVADEAVDDVDEEELVDTGLEVAPLVLVGLFIAVVGIGAVVATRRRDRTGASV